MPTVLSNGALRNGSLMLTSPAALFAAGEVGVWYDPSDMYTLFQDAAGTTPVTAVEQPVGLMLDKSKGAVGTNGVKRVNLLSWSENMTNAVWLMSNATTSATIVTSTGTANASVYQQYNSTAITTWKYSAKVLKGTSFVLAISGSTSGAGVVFNGSTGAYVNNTTTGSIWSVSSYSCATHPDDSGYWLASVTIANSSTDNNQVFAIAAINTSTGTTWRSGWGASVGTTLTVTNHDLRLNSEATTAPTYQRITADWPSTMAGNHATQSTAASRPVWSERYNLLTKTEQFDDAVWSKVKTTITANNTTAPDGTSTADLMLETNDTGRIGIDWAGVTTTSHTFSVALKKQNRSAASILVWSSTGQNVCVVFDLDAGTVSKTQNLGTTYSGVSSSCTDLGNQWYRCSVTTTRSNGTTYYSVDINTTNNPTLNTDGVESYTGDPTKGLYIWGADLRVANDGVNIPSYQRVNTSTDYDTVGIPAYLRFDGVDDSMATGNVDFSSTDKMTVWSGFRKLADTDGIIAELSANFNTNNGSFYFASQPSGKFGVSSRGTAGGISTQEATVSGYSAPVAAVLCGTMNISASANVLRANGVAGATATGGQGVGNFGNYPLYIGRRGGSTIPLNGRLYGLVVRGASSTATEIANTERWLNLKTRAY